MQHAKSIIALVILTTLFSMMMVSNVSAVSVEAINPSLMVDTTTANNTTASSGILDSLSDIFVSTIKLIIDIILTPFTAIASIWTSWAGTMGWWAGPIVAAFVIIVVFVMIRIYSEFDEWMDKNSG